jgi:hypothetical protein
MQYPIFPCASYPLCLVLPEDGLSKSKHVRQCITHYNVYLLTAGVFSWNYVYKWKLHIASSAIRQVQHKQPPTLLGALLRRFGHILCSSLTGTLESIIN